MTIEEFYNWAIENGVEDYYIQIQYRDSGGYYCGRDDLIAYDIEIDRERMEVTI